MAWESGTFFSRPPSLSLSLCLYLSLPPFTHFLPTPCYPFCHCHFPHHPAFVSEYSLCLKSLSFAADSLLSSIQVCRFLAPFFSGTDAHCACVCVFILLSCPFPTPFKVFFTSIVFHFPYYLPFSFLSHSLNKMYTGVLPATK